MTRRIDARRGKAAARAGRSRTSRSRSTGTADFLRWFAARCPSSRSGCARFRLRANGPSAMYAGEHSRPGRSTRCEPRPDSTSTSASGRPCAIEPGRDDGDVNRAIEAEVNAVGGHKSLYSDAYYDAADFWARYGGEDYQARQEALRPAGRGCSTSTRRRCNGGEPSSWTTSRSGHGRSGAVTLGGHVRAALRCRRAGALLGVRRELRGRRPQPTSASAWSHPARCPTCDCPRRRSAWPAPTSRGTSTSRVRTRATPTTCSRSMDDGCTCSARPCPRRWPGARTLGPQDVRAAAAARPGGRAAAGAADCGTPRPRRRGDPATTTTCRTRSTSGCSDRR